MTHYRKIRIISDGTPYGSDIQDAETGETLRYVESVDIRISGNKELRGVMTVFQPEANIVANVEVEPSPCLSDLHKTIKEACALLEEWLDAMGGQWETPETLHERTSAFLERLKEEE